MCFMFYNCYYMHEREREFAQVLDVLFFPVLLVYCL